MVATRATIDAHVLQLGLAQLFCQDTRHAKAMVSPVQPVAWPEPALSPP
jgi:hypothetical protein